jgi:hypothetical protein
VKHSLLANVLSLGGAAALLLGSASSASAFGVRDHTTGQPTHGAANGVCGTPEPTLPCAGRVTAAGPQHRRVLFMNRQGGVYTHAAAPNSASNQTSIGTGGSIPAVVATDAQWTEIMDCVKGFYADFNIDVVDVEPTSGDYEESVVGGSSDMIGVDAGQPGLVLLGIADRASQMQNSCILTENGISFSFAATHGSMAIEANRRELCITIAHEAGHVFGLDHEMLPEDLMSYAETAEKAFVDQASPCADSSIPQNPVACYCDVETNAQNSHEVLAAYLGPNDKVAPTLKIDSPVEGAKVGPGFTITATAADDTELNHLELVINGATVASDQSSPFSFKVPTNVSIGELTFDVVAVDKADNRTTLTRKVTVEPGCSGDSDCAEDEQCVNQACLGDVGHLCSTANDCADGLCIPTPGSKFDKFCTRSCTAGDDSCPSGFACDNSTGGLLKCNPADGAGGCGCRAGGHGDAPAGLSALGVLGLMSFIGVRARRRRRS